MKKYKTIFLAIWLLLGGCQNKNLYNANFVDEKLYKQYNVKKQNTNIWQLNRNFTSDINETIVDTVALIKELSKIPKNMNGLGVLDWEGEIEKGFEQNAPENLFNYSLEAHLLILKIAKKYRPNLKWSVYSYPITSFWGRNQSWRKQNERLIPLMKECDVLCPSLYLYYPDKEVGAINNQNYAKENSEEILYFAQELNKKVYPFVWHRFHPSNKEFGLELIPLSQFKHHIEDVFSSHFNGHKIDGIVWWGSDSYYYNVKAEALIKESQSFKSFEDYYYKNVIKPYSSIINSAYKNRR